MAGENKLVRINFGGNFVMGVLNGDCVNFTKETAINISNSIRVSQKMLILDDSEVSLISDACGHAAESIEADGETINRLTSIADKCDDYLESKTS